MSAALMEVRGLHDFWAGMMGYAPPRLGMPERVMLDALGLGIGQTTAVFRDRPEWDAFAAWIIETAGEPDPVPIARYHAWLDGAPPPAETRAWIAAIEAMPPVLDAADLAHWEREGYVVLRGAATPEQAAEAAELLYGLVGATPGDPESWYGRRDVNSIMVEHFQAPVLSAIHANPRIHKACAQLYGTADLWVQIDRMSFNPPVRERSPGLGLRLHWDASLVTPVPLFIQGVLYLTDTSPDQGALELVPGFHRRLESWLASIGDADPRNMDISADAITVGAGAGDLVLWHQALPHGASPNRAALPRLAHYMALYSPEILPQAEWR